MRTLLPLSLTILLGWNIAAADPYVSYETDTAFADVMEGLKLAIEERGMTINNVMHMAEMLDRTGADLGAGKQLYSKAESIEFCSATLSRKMIEVNPARIANCPFIISVYVLPDQPDKTYLIHRRVNDADNDEVMQEVETMLESVAGAAAKGW